MLSSSGTLRTRLRQDLEELLALEGGRDLFLSAYLDVSPGPDGNRSHAIYLRRRLSELEKIFLARGLDDKARRLREHAARLEEFLETELQKETRGVAFFLSHEIAFSKQIELPVPLRNKLVASGAPNLDVLIELVEQNRHYCVVALAQRWARIMSVYLADVVDAEELTAETGVERNAGVANGRASVLSNGHAVISISSSRNSAMPSTVTGKAEKPDGLVILATPENAGELRRQLKPELQRQLVAISALPPETSTDELVNRIMATLQTAAVSEERRISEQLYDRLANDYMAVAGLEETLLRLQSGQLETLVISDLFATRGQRCSRCNSLFAPAVSTCLYCGGPTVEADLRNWMEKVAEHQHLRIEILQDRSFLDHLGRSGGIPEVLSSEF